MSATNPALVAFLQKEVAPLASQCDSDFATLNNLFNRMGELGLYALTVRAELEQKPLSKQAQFDNKAFETKSSGALSFLTSQINLSTRLIYEGQNEDLKKTTLPKILKGELRIANAVSHLRSKPVFEVERVQNGYYVSGEIFWLTGFNHFEQFVFGFKHANQEFFALLPFEPSSSLIISDVIPVMIMQATQTVRATLKRFYIADENIIGSQPEGNWNQQMRQTPSLLAYFYGLGLSAVEVLEISCENKAIIASFQQRLRDLYEIIIRQDQDDYTVLRVELTQCVWQCIQCGIIVSKGKAMDPNSTISRIYREIVQFNALAALPDYIENQLLYISQRKPV